MNDTTETFLEGKVLKCALPLFQGPPWPGATSLKRLLLTQGELAQFHDSEDGMRYLAYIELRAGSVRGNHFHRNKVERVYLISGKALLTAQDTSSEARATVTLSAGDLVLIHTGIAHAFRTLQPGHAIEFSDSCFDPIDIHPLAVD